MKQSRCRVDSATKQLGMYWSTCVQTKASERFFGPRVPLAGLTHLQFASIKLVDAVEGVVDLGVWGWKVRAVHPEIRQGRTACKLYTGIRL